MSTSGSIDLDESKGRRTAMSNNTALDDINEVIEAVKASQKANPEDPRWTAELVNAVATKASITGEFPKT